MISCLLDSSPSHARSDAQNLVERKGSSQDLFSLPRTEHILAIPFDNAYGIKTRKGDSNELEDLKMHQDMMEITGLIGPSITEDPSLEVDALGDER